MIQAAAFGWSAWRSLASCESVMVLLQSPYHLCLATLLPILLCSANCDGVVEEVKVQAGR